MKPTQPEPPNTRSPSLSPPKPAKEPRAKGQTSRDETKPSSSHCQAISWIRGQAKRW